MPGHHEQLVPNSRTARVVAAEGKPGKCRSDSVVWDRDG